MQPIDAVVLNAFFLSIGCGGLALQIRNNPTAGWSSKDAGTTAILIVFAGIPAAPHIAIAGEPAGGGIALIFAAGLTEAAMKILLPLPRDRRDAPSSPGRAERGGADGRPAVSLYTETRVIR